MKWIDAITNALTDLGGKGTEDEILNMMKRKKYRTFENAKTPEKSLNMYLNKYMENEVVNDNSCWHFKKYS